MKVKDLIAQLQQVDGDSNMCVEITTWDMQALISENEGEYSILVELANAERCNSARHFLKLTLEY